MNEREFCYWLQGLFEVGNAKVLDEHQVQIIKDHLALVFKKETPERNHSGPSLTHDDYRRILRDNTVVQPYKLEPTIFDPKPYASTSIGPINIVDTKPIAIC